MLFLFTLGVSTLGTNLLAKYSERFLQHRGEGVHDFPEALHKSGTDPHCERVKYKPPPASTGEDDLEYDFRNQHQDCTVPIRDQGLCSGSWAIAIADQLSLCICASSAGAEGAYALSPQYMLSCLSETACFGEDARAGFLHLKTVGLPTDACFPFSSEEHGVPPACPSACVDSTPFSFTKIKGAHAYGGNATRIAELLIQHGPLYTEMFVYKDFLNYHSGVYNRTSTDYIGTQAVLLIGFGVDHNRNVSYWIARNSWGPDWGESGLFRIKKGVNECGIENRVVYMDVNTDSGS